MSIDKLTIHAAPPPASSVAPQKKVAAPSEAVATQPETKPSAKLQPADIGALANRIEGYLKSVNRALEFKVDNASGRTVVTVRDAENGEVIRQIPNEEVLRFAQLAEEQTIVLLNETV
jgi:flagellar protein FlaG